MNRVLRPEPTEGDGEAVGAGIAMTTNLGAVGVYEVDVWRVSCSVGVGATYWSAS